MGIHEGRGQLNRAVRDLASRWLDTKEAWDDEQSAKFEEAIIVPLEKEIRSAVGAMDHMAGIVAQARRDCGND